MGKHGRKHQLAVSKIFNDYHKCHKTGNYLENVGTDLLIENINTLKDVLACRDQKGCPWSTHVEGDVYHLGKHYYFDHESPALQDMQFPQQFPPSMTYEGKLLADFFYEGKLPTKHTWVRQEDIHQILKLMEDKMQMRIAELEERNRIQENHGILSHKHPPGCGDRCRQEQQHRQELSNAIFRQINNNCVSCDGCGTRCR